MAVFNPGTPDVNAPNFDRYSRGSEPNTGFADLFKGAGNTIAIGASGVDQAIQSNIRSDAYKAYDKTNEDFGLTPAVNESIDATGGGKVMPQDLQDSMGYLKLMQRSFDSGGMQGYHYWGRMENEVKTLRQKYPGYREQIDNIVSDITGATPANALRNSLLSDMEQNAAHSGDIHKQKQGFILENSQYLSAGSMQHWQKDPIGREDAAIAEIQQGKALKVNLDTGMAQLNYKASLGQDVTNDALSTGIAGQSSLTDHMWHDAGTLFFKDYQDLTTKLTDYQKDGVIDPQEQATLTALSEKLRTEHAQTMHDYWNTPIKGNSNGDSLMSLTAGKSAERDAAIKMENDFFEQQVTAPLTGQMGLFKLNQAMVDATTSNDTVKALRDPYVRTMSILSKIVGGNQFMNLLESKGQTEALTSTMEAIRGLQQAQTMTAAPGSVPSTASGIEDAKKVGAATPEFVRTKIEDIKQSILSPEAPMSTKLNTIESVFGPDNNKFFELFDQGKHQENWVRLFGELTTPDITKAVKDTGNQDAWKMYNSWVIDKWHVLFDPSAVNLKTAEQNTNGGVKLQYNPEANEFNVTIDPTKVNKTGMDMVYLKGQADATQQQVTQMNSYLKYLQPIMDENKADYSTVVKGLMDSIGVNADYPGTGVKEPRQKDENTSQADTTVQQASNDSMLNYIADAEGTDRGRGYNETLGYGAFTAGDQNLTSMSLDQIDSLQTGMLGNPDNVYNSSAVGRYQIVQQTLRGLRNDLGLKGTDTFDQATQDKLAKELLKRRGGDVAGLRSEWEGLRRRPSKEILAMLNK